MDVDVEDAIESRSALDLLAPLQRALGVGTPKRAIWKLKVAEVAVIGKAVRLGWESTGVG